MEFYANINDDDIEQFVESALGNKEFCDCDSVTDIANEVFADRISDGGGCSQEGIFDIIDKWADERGESLVETLIEEKMADESKDLNNLSDEDCLTLLKRGLKCVTAQSPAFAAILTALGAFPEPAPTPEPETEKTRTEKVIEWMATRDPSKMFVGFKEGDSPWGWTEEKHEEPDNLKYECYVYDGDNNFHVPISPYGTQEERFMLSKLWVQAGSPSGATGNWTRELLMKRIEEKAS